MSPENEGDESDGEGRVEGRRGKRGHEGRGLKVSISPTFYEHFFCSKAFCAALLHLQFVFVIFWRKKRGGVQVSK